MSIAKPKRMTPAQRLRRLEWDYQALMRRLPSPLKVESVTRGEARVVTVRNGRGRWRRIEWRGDVWWERV